MGHTKSLVPWENLGCVSLFSVTEVLFSSGFSAVSCCPEHCKCQGYTKLPMCFSLFSASSTALYSPQGDEQHQISRGRSFLLFLLLINIYNLRAQLAVLEGFQSKVMCTAFYGINMFHWSTAIARAASETEGQNNSLHGRSLWMMFPDLCYAESQTRWSEQSLLASKSMNLCSDYTSEHEQPKLKVVIYWMLATGRFLFLNKQLLLKGSL